MLKYGNFWVIKGKLGAGHVKLVDRLYWWMVDATILECEETSKHNCFAEQGAVEIS